MKNVEGAVGKGSIHWKFNMNHKVCEPQTGAKLALADPGVALDLSWSLELDPPPPAFFRAKSEPDLRHGSGSGCLGLSKSKPGQPFFFSLSSF